MKIKPTHHLIGYCDSCEKSYQFIDGVHKRSCPKCGEKFSRRIGNQLTTYRTFRGKIENGHVDLKEFYEEKTDD